MAEKSPKSSSSEKAFLDLTEITIRAIELSDVDDLMLWATDDEVTRFCTWDTYNSRNQALDYINNIAIPHPWSKVICLKNRAIGAISVTPNLGIIQDKCRAELGYVLARKYWGKGIVTRAVKMVVSTIFQEWSDVERIEAIVDVDNKGSQRVLEKCGFQKEAVLRKYKQWKGKTRDCAMFSFLSTDLQVD
ncbi:hypothetical protein M9H77_35190 [Catharanthus roseus]|uniref:Uncharacterized protein n=1 Tax=Catharanthus roseus TaxID=4058 RepID=A0ACB9ZP20_CATRO|nr:hypothetical protein M9H77_35190 [Catharanthus roseus]